MNAATILLAKYTRDLLNQPEGSVIILGRINVPRGDTSSLQIAVDQLAPAVPLTDSQQYDSVNELMLISQQWRSVMTINFMGALAYDEVIKFITLNRHQNGLNLKRALGIDIQAVSQIQDLKLLQGEVYSERYEIQVTLNYNISNNIETLRIDTAQFDEILTS